METTRTTSRTRIRTSTTPDPPAITLTRPQAVLFHGPREQGAIAQNRAGSDSVAFDGADLRCDVDDHCRAGVGRGEQAQPLGRSGVTFARAGGEFAWRLVLAVETVLDVERREHFGVAGREAPLTSSCNFLGS